MVPESKWAEDSMMSRRELLRSIVGAIGLTLAGKVARAGDVAKLEPSAIACSTTPIRSGYKGRREERDRSRKTQPSSVAPLRSRWPIGVFTMSEMRTSAARHRKHGHEIRSGRGSVLRKRSANPVLALALRSVSLA
jgi:hypothetical protein